MDKDVVYIYNGILAIKKNEMFCHLQQHGLTWRVLVKKVRGRQTLYVITYMWNLKNKTHERM